jgi:hypothetical protein
MHPLLPNLAMQREKRWQGGDFVALQHDHRINQFITGWFLLQQTWQAINVGA